MTAAREIIRKDSKFTRWLSSIEESHLGLGWPLLIILASCYGRGFLEGALEKSGRIGFGLEPWQSLLMVFVHLPAFFLTLFLLIVLFLHFITKEKVGSITKILAAGSPVILLPVLIDVLFFGGGKQLYYLSSLAQIPEYLFYTFYPWHSLEGASPGIRIEVALGCLAGAGYCWIKTRSWLKAAAGFILIFLSCLWAGSWPLLLAHLWSVISGYSPDIVFGLGGLVPTDTAKYALSFLFIMTFMGCLWLWRWNRRSVLLLWESSRPWRTAHYGAMVFLGYLAGVLTVGPSYPQLFVNPFDYLFLPAAIISITAAFQSAVLVNDLFDRESDIYTGRPNPLVKNLLDEIAIKRWAWIYAIFSLAWAMVLGWPAMMIIFFVLALSLVYSAPPLRLKRFYPLSILVIALASLASAWLGFSAFGRDHTLSLFPSKIAWFIIICFGLSFATKDVNDVEGDRRTGVITLPVLLGEAVGKKAVSVLVMAGYLIGPAILGIYWLLLPAALAGLVTVWIINRPRPNEGFIFTTYFIYGALLVLALILKPQIIRTAPHDDWGKMLSGLDYYEARDYKQAVLILKDQAERSGDHRLLWAVARSFYQLGDRGNALKWGQSLLRRYPLFEKGYHLVTRIFRDEDQLDQAAAILGRALDLGVAPAAVHQSLGDLMYSAGNLKEAGDNYFKALLWRPKDDRLWAKLSIVKLRSADTAAALVLTGRALGINRDNLVASMTKAEVLLNRRDYLGARATLEPVKNEGKRNAKYLYLWGKIMENLGCWDEAVAAYEETLAIDKKYYPAWEGLSRCYLVKGDVNSAQRALERAISFGSRSEEDRQLTMDE